MVQWMLRLLVQWAAKKVSDTEIATVGPHGNHYHLHVVDDAWIAASRNRGSIHRGVTDDEGNTCDGDDSQCAGMLYVTVNVAPGKAARVASTRTAARSRPISIARAISSSTVRCPATDGLRPPGEDPRLSQF